MIRVNLNVLLAQHRMSVNELAQAIGITAVNVSVLKNERAKAIRFSTLDAICRVLDCQPGDVLEWVDDDRAGGDAPGDDTADDHKADDSGARLR